MLLETLVISVCAAGQPGCSQATQAYYQSNVEIQNAVKRVESYSKELVGEHEYIVYVVAPIYAAASGKDAVFKLKKNLNLKINFKDESIGLIWGF